ncbi:MAG: GNAT family N-acetyltransferase [Bdellovibrionota bacterium]
MLEVKQISPPMIDNVLRFLSSKEETSQFLINNLKEHGPALSDHPNSGNYKALVENKTSIRGVFCLNKRGNLLAQIDCLYNPNSIIEECLKEKFEVKGFIGDWDTIDPLFRSYKERNPSFKATYNSKEILYRYVFQESEQVLRKNDHVRFLESNDFNQWHPLNLAYRKELNIPSDLTEQQNKDLFISRTKNKCWWGYFEKRNLISIAALNSTGETIGQVGGVFTIKGKRKQGYSKATVLHLLRDCRDMHRHSKSILFTGETDIPAQKLYESIGYEKIGYYALILS